MEAIRTVFESFESLTTPTEIRGRRVTASLGGGEFFDFEDESEPIIIDENNPDENFTEETGQVNVNPAPIMSSN